MGSKPARGDVRATRALAPSAPVEPSEAAASATTAEPSSQSAAPPPGLRRRGRGPIALLILAVACAAFAWYLHGGSVRFAQGLVLESATMAREVTAGGTLTLTLRYRAERALDADYWIFVHVEAEAGGVDAARHSGDAAPPTPATGWGAQEFVHTVRIPVDGKDKPGRYAVYTGLYDRTSGHRLRVLDPPSPDDRVLLGTVDVVTEDADESDRTVTGADIHMRTRLELWRLWAPWLLPIGIASGVAALLLRRRRAETSTDVDDETEADDRLSRAVRFLVLAVPAVLFFLGILVVLEFVKDDAYISFRYAHNLVTGQGLVFNHGERVEGFTNFLWVFVLAPFEALGWDLFQVCEVLGTLLGIACLVVTGRLTAWVNGDRRMLTQMWGALWLATSASFVLWAKSGLEQPLVSLLPIAGAFVLWRARSAAANERRYLVAGLIMGAGAMTRPELHLMAILVGLPLVVDAVRARRVRRAEWLYVAGILAVTVPCHAFRFFYYGTLIPNTFYAKTASGWIVWHEGIKTVADMFAFNHTGLLAVMAPLAFANRRRTLEKATMGAIVVAFLAFYASVGVDEMQWHRLFLPALPFLCVLAALGIQNLLDAVVNALERRGSVPAARTAAWCVGWAAVVVACRANFLFTYREVNGFNGHGDLAGTFHPDLGKFLVRHERPGGLVAFQDMGSTPYHAPDIDFLDFVGLVDKTVAHARHDMGLHAFVATNAETAARYEAQMRDYFFARNPEWTILTIYTPLGEETQVAKAFDEDPTGGAFGSVYGANAFEWHLWDDPRFRERYVPVRTWPRSAAYYLALWRRRDLWDQTPREVVLDAPPAELSGVHATFAGGLELLGSEMTHTTPERHEAFVTTWWKLPGPMPRDVYFFLHFVGGGAQIPADHVPGDWMYPADRWKAGQVLEDRTLFQVPPFTMLPGSYEVYLGAYRRSTGERLAIVAGGNAGENRVHLGTLVVTTFHPMIEQLIPPTRVDVMRKYPDRILDPHRLSGP